MQVFFIQMNNLEGESSQEIAQNKRYGKILEKVIPEVFQVEIYLYNSVLSMDSDKVSIGSLPPVKTSTN